MKRFNKTLALTLVSWGIMADNASALITIDTVSVGNAGTGYAGAIDPQGGGNGVISPD